MKLIANLVFFLFICLVIQIPVAFSQDKCPSNIAAIKNNSRFTKAADNDYLYFLFGSSPGAGVCLICVYHKNGNLRLEAPYKDDKTDGLVSAYRENGKILATATYVKGSPVSGMCHYTNGTTRPLTNAELMNLDKGLAIECD